MFFWKKKKPDASNKRKVERFNWEDTTDIFTPEGEVKIAVKDISAGGLRFLADKLLPKNTVLKIKINYNPIDFPLRLLILRNVEVAPGVYEHGGEFINTPPEEMTLLQDHLELIKAELHKRNQ